MEGGVEAGNLRQSRKAPADDPDRLQIVRLMQRRERHELLERLDSGLVDKHRVRESLAAMDDPMPDRHQLAVFLMLTQPCDEVHQGFFMPEMVAGTPGHLVEDRTAGILGDETR